MLKDKYCILSFPNNGKHYLLRTSKSTDEIALQIDDVLINASIASIADSFDEANNTYNNLKEM